MPTADLIAYVFWGIELGFQALKVRVLSWLFFGGWKYVFRTIGFWIDLSLVKLIARLYTYFHDLVSGDMFNEEVITALMKNVYVFIGIIMFFRLLMVVIKYVVNPDLVSDAKTGANSLIKRCILGLCGILFIPTLFDLGLDLQRSILDDQIIQQIIVPHDMLPNVSKKMPNAGKYIGTYVLAGFISPGQNASEKAIMEYKQGIQNGDFSSLTLIKKDGFLSTTFEYDYLFLVSTFCLCYVLYIMLKYCLDIATRFFRLLIYQMLAPIAMIEYMINGSDDGVFKAWRQGVLSSYFMLFIRVLAIWFLVFVMVLMTDSTLSQGTLLAKDDYFLKALIIIALLGFLLDLPKLVGQVFGLDFEQESHATGVLKQVGGMIKGAAVGALAVGGAAVGGAIGVGKAAIGGTKAGQQLDKMKSDFAKDYSWANSMINSTKSATSGVIGAALSSNSFTGSMYKGYSNQSQAQDKARGPGVYEESKEREKKEEQENKKKEQEKRELENSKSLREMKDAMNGGNLKIDPTSIAAMAGAVAGAIHATSGPGISASASPNPSSTFTQQQASTSAVGGPAQGQVSNGTTVTLDNIDVKVNGKATATYDGGLETNITGKATTKYNDGLDVQVAGQANAKYDQGIDVQVNGPANAKYDQGIDVQVNGPASAKYDKGLDVQVNGLASAKYDKGLDVQVNGPASAKYDKGLDVQVAGQANAKYDGDVSTVVGGSSVTTVEGGTNTVVVGDTVTTVAGNTEVNLQDVDVKRNKNNHDSNNA